jgi:hypothetical protein
LRSGVRHRNPASLSEEEGGVNAYRRLSTVLALVTLGLGVALIVVTIGRGGGQTGFLLGALFIVAGGGRLYLQRAR